MASHAWHLSAVQSTCACCGAPASVASAADAQPKGSGAVISWCEDCWARLQEVRDQIRRSYRPEWQPTFDEEHPLPWWRLEQLA